MINDEIYSEAYWHYRQKYKNWNYEKNRAPLPKQDLSIYGLEKADNDLKERSIICFANENKSTDLSLKVKLAEVLNTYIHGLQMIIDGKNYESHDDYIYDPELTEMLLYLPRKVRHERYGQVIIIPKEIDMNLYKDYLDKYISIQTALMQEYLKTENPSWKQYQYVNHWIKFDQTVPLATNYRQLKMKGKDDSAFNSFDTHFHWDRTVDWHIQKFRDLFYVITKGKDTVEPTYRRNYDRLMEMRA